MDYRKHVLVYLHGSAREWCMQLLHFSLHEDNRGRKPRQMITSFMQGGNVIRVKSGKVYV